MSFAILKYKLPDEREAFEAAHRGEDLKFAVQEFDSWLRNKVKHGDHSEEVQKAFEECRDQLWHELNEYGVSW